MAEEKPILNPAEPAIEPSEVQPTTPGLSKEDDQLISNMHGIGEAAGEVKKILPTIIKAKAQSKDGFSKLINTALTALADKLPSVVKLHAIQFGKSNPQAAEALKEYLKPSTGVPKVAPATKEGSDVETAEAEEEDEV